MIGNAVSANGPMRLTTTTGPALLSCALMSSMVSVTTTREFPPIFSAKLRNFCSLRPQSTTDAPEAARSEEHTSELQSLMRISYAVFCLKKQKKTKPKREE